MASISQDISLLTSRIIEVEGERWFILDHNVSEDHLPPIYDGGSPPQRIEKYSSDSIWFKLYN